MNRELDRQMSMTMTNQKVVMATMVKLENQNLLNELVLVRIIFPLPIENMTIQTMTTNHHPKPIFISKEEEDGNETHNKARTVARNIDECRWGNLFFHNAIIFAQTQIFVVMCIRTTSTIMGNDSIRLHIVRRIFSPDWYLYSMNRKKNKNEKEYPGINSSVDRIDIFVCIVHFKEKIFWWQFHVIFIHFFLLLFLVWLEGEYRISCIAIREKENSIGNGNKHRFSSLFSRSRVKWEAKEE